MRGPPSSHPPSLAQPELEQLSPVSLSSTSHSEMDSLTPRGRGRGSNRHRFGTEGAELKSQTATFESSCGADAMAQRDARSLAELVREQGPIACKKREFRKTLKVLGFASHDEGACDGIYDEARIALTNGEWIGGDQFLAAYKAAGWSHHFDPFGGSEYFYNDHTGKCVWGNLGAGSIATQLFNDDELTALRGVGGGGGVQGARGDDRLARPLSLGSSSDQSLSSFAEEKQHIALHAPKPPHSAPPLAIVSAWETAAAMPPPPPPQRQPPSAAASANYGVERRADPSDGRLYTMNEFIGHCACIYVGGWCPPPHSIVYTALLKSMHFHITANSPIYPILSTHNRPRHVRVGIRKISEKSKGAANAEEEAALGAKRTLQANVRGVLFARFDQLATVARNFLH